MKATIAYQSSNDTISLAGFESPNYLGMLDYDWYQDYWTPVTEKHYHKYMPVTEYRTQIIRSEDTYKKAMTIGKILLRKRLLKSNKLKDFIELVEMIAKEI
jgi:hypothetical protein